MIEQNTTVFSKLILAISGFLVLSSCTSTKSSFDARYAGAWKKVLQSEAWKDALKSKNTSESYKANDYFASTSDVVIVDDARPLVKSTTATFTKKYNSLVSRAYYKIISEAEKADKGLKAQQERLNSEKDIFENRKNKAFQNTLELTNKRYEAHQNMLQGLKSWKIFTDDITGDLKYFKAENESEIYAMYDSGVSDAAMVNILVYKLADLYHFED